MKLNLRSNKENTVYTIIIIVIVGAFIVFFSSKEWLYDDSSIRHTPYNEKITKLSQTDITIENWEHNKKENFMEIQLRKEQSGDDYVPPKINIQAYNYEDKQEIKTEKAYETDDMILVRLINTNEDLRFIDLKIDEIRDDKVVEEVATASTDTTDAKVNIDDKESSVILFGDYRKIKNNNNLKEKSEIEYKIMFVTSDIEKVSDEIKDIKDNKIPKEDKRIVELENGIERMESEIEYTTGEEKRELESDIKGNENKIKNTLDKKEKLKEDIVELQNKRDKYDKKLNDLGAEKLNQKE